MSNDFYSDYELASIFGRRPIGTGLFEPIELGWVCPEDHTHETTWSEFNKHIWCYQCKKDYFTLICPKMLTTFTSEIILKKETEKLWPLIKEWNIEKYKRVRVEILKPKTYDLSGYIPWVAE